MLVQVPYRCNGKKGDQAREGREGVVGLGRDKEIKIFFKKEEDLEKDDPEKELIEEPRLEKGGWKSLSNFIGGHINKTNTVKQGNL